METTLEVQAIKLTDEIDDALFNRLLDYLDGTKRERIAKRGNREDAKRTLIGDLMMRRQISSRLGIANRDIALAYNAFGKPVLPHSEGIHFNVSHSGEWIVCAGDNREVGVDVEQVRPIDLNIAKRFFHPSEFAQLMAVEDHRRLELFFKLWTLKESYIKAIGKGLSRPLNTFSFDLTNGVPTLDSGVGEDEGDYFCKLYDWDRHYLVAVCSRSALLPDAIERMELVSFCHEVLEHPAD